MSLNRSPPLPSHHSRGNALPSLPESHFHCHDCCNCGLFGGSRCQFAVVGRLAVWRDLLPSWEIRKRMLVSHSDVNRFRLSSLTGIYGYFPLEIAARLVTPSRGHGLSRSQRLRS